ncbi:MAG TPA: hypothetical protein VMR49_01215 [Candidatus Paceibacterota bacterium]|jgi:hypothetical protein|nr:hypothetical protein [Candidatus Paceibacterota bacterium]
MENSFQTSFIPKKPVDTEIAAKRSSSTSLFKVITILLLIVMGAASGGLFLYKSYLTSQKEVLSSSLAAARDSFEQSTIDELALFDKRTKAAKQILNSHIVLSPMFALLGNLTIPQIQYTKFSQETTDSGFSVKISGVALDYKSIALQADVFNSSSGRSFKNVVFSNLTKQTNNYVGFDLAFDVDPALLSYEKNSLLELSSAAASAPSNNIPPATNLNNTSQ